MRSVLSSIVLIAASFAIAVGLFEFACRTIVDTGMHYHLEMWKYAVSVKEVADDPTIGHRHKPSSMARLMGVDVSINADGLRDDSRNGRSADATKILMLGDSITFGWGVPQNETVSQRLESSLSQGMGRAVSVINSGVGNYNTSMEVAWFEQYGLAMKPDLVVLNVFINDAEEPPTPAVVHWYDTILYSRVILFGAFDTVRRLIFGGHDWKDYYTNLYLPDAAGWQVMQWSISNLAEMCRANNIPLIVVDYPELRELEPYPFDEVSEKVSALAADLNVEYVSVLPAVQGQNPSDLWVTVPDPHPNSYANKLFAEFLEPIIGLAANPTN